MSTTDKLSVIILAHRADDRLERAIASAQFADEVLIVDNQSGANWSNLADQYSLRVEPYPTPLTDWSAVRNWSLSLATHPWVFFLDSDEIITPESIAPIATVISQQHSGALVKRSDVFFDHQLQYGEAGAQLLLRMGQKSKLRFHRPVHEEAQLQGEPVVAPIQLLHHSHLSANDFFTAIHQYAYLEAKHRHNLGERLYLPNLLILPLGKFVFNYVFKLGFLDGWAGLIYAFMMSLHSLFVRVFQYELAHAPNETTN